MRRIEFGSTGEGDVRRRAAVEVVQTLIARWERHEETPDDEVLAAHPDLLPELSEELRNARMLRRSLLFARRNSASRETPPPDVLSDDELEAPIEVPGSDVDAAAEDPRAPRIPGYLILNEVRRGGQAVVFRALQESTG